MMFATQRNWQEFIHAWESHRLPKQSWNHAAHVAVGAGYAVRFQDEALHHLRTGIKAYNLATGGDNTSTSGYHETLTRFWLETIQAELAHPISEWEAANHIVKMFGHRRDFFKSFYDFDVVNSVEARRQWIAPNRSC
jgi:hypothetical protein